MLHPSFESLHQCAVFLFKFHMLFAVMLLLPLILTLSDPAPDAQAAGSESEESDDQGDESDHDEDRELDDEIAPEQNSAPADSPEEAPDGPTYEATWTTQATDHRRSASAVDMRPTFPHLNNDEKHDILQLFLACVPQAYINSTLIPATSKRLTDLKKEGITLGEFYRWLGLALLVSLNDVSDRRDLWAASTDPLRPHPDLRDYMSRSRFEDIQHAIRLVPHEPSKTDRFRMVRDFINAWNENMKNEFTPSYVCCLDESMVAWLNKWTCPGWMNVPRKPHPFGNEYHTIACALTHIIFRVELSEGKDRPAGSAPQDESAFGKMGGLILRMTESLRDTLRVVIMDSAFCQLKTIIEMRKRGIFATSVIKQKHYWPKYIKGDLIDKELGETPIGTVRARKGVMDDVPFMLVGLRDSKHVLKLVATHGSLALVKGEMKGRRDPATNQRVEFEYPEVISQYYSARHAVDDNNNIRQGSRSLEAGFQVNHWPLRQFIALMAISEVNAMSFYNYIHSRDATYNANTSFKSLSLTDFRYKLAARLINNHFLPAAAPVEQAPKRSRRNEQPHVLVKAPKYTGKWLGTAWKEVKSEYLKRACAGVYQDRSCPAETREYCVCDRLRFWCTDCFAFCHLASIRDDH